MLRYRKAGTGYRFPAMDAALPRLRDLRAFDAALRLGSVSAAAAALGLTQPAASDAIRRLEARLSVRLLERGPQGVAATAAGEAFAPRARAALDRLASLAGDRAAGRLTDPALRAHAAIAEHGSLRAAARALGVGAAALHRAAGAFERAVGGGLYRRGPDGLAPTPAGREAARVLSLAASDLAQAIAEAKPGAERLVLGVLPLAPRRPLARAVARAAAAGGPALSIVEGDYGTLAERLRSGRVDALFGALRAPPPFDDLVEQPLAADPFAVALAAGHPQAAGTTARALSGLGWVVPAADMPRRRVVEALFATLPARPRVVLETSSLEMTVAAVREAGCAALLSAAQIAAQPGLAALAWPLPAGADRVVGLTLRADWRPTPGQARALAWLAEAFGPTAPSASA
ncbi:MAG: LysR family transcriptional regulator [Acetobacteraceae bacterium]